MSYSLGVGSLDAFGRLRVGTPATVFDSKQTSNPTLLWTTLTTGSGSVAAWSQARASTTLSVGVAAGRAVRQTRRKLHYQPGKSQLLLATGVFGAAVTGVTKRIGQFDDANGLFLEQTSTGGYQCVVRSSVTGSPVDLPYAVTVPPGYDMTKALILAIDYEWLGVGKVRFGVVPDGVPVAIADAANAGVLSSVYMSTPQLPVRYEVVSTGTTAGSSLESICCSVQSEGGQDPTGVTVNARSGAKSLNTTTFVPLVQIRLASGSGVTAFVEQAQAFISATQDIEWVLVLNPTVSGGTPASWVAASTNTSGVEVDVTATGTITAGAWEHPVQGGFGDRGFPTAETEKSLIALGTLLSGTRDVLTLAARALSASPSARGSLTWRELQ